MLDPKKLLERLPKLESQKPFRYLGRRLVQAMAEASRENAYIGRRSGPGRYLVVRTVDSEEEKEHWEQQFADSRAAILKEIDREAIAREIQLRSTAEVDLCVLTSTQADAGEAERLLTAVLEPGEVPAALARLREEREVILPRRVRTLVVESEPADAQLYLDDRPAGVTPCRIEDFPDGEHHLVLSRPGFLPHEETLRIEPGKQGQTVRHRVTLQPEPEMGVLEVRTFPPGARVTVGPETRETPNRWRLPAGRVELRVEMDDFEAQALALDLPPTPESRPHLVQVKLRYVGPEADQVVGRLIVYKPGSVPSRRVEDPAPEREPAGNRIALFFRDTDAEGAAPPPPSVTGTMPPPRDEPEVLGERPIRRGVLIIGREDPGSELVPDIKLFDAENSVTRGCHAWLWVYADVSTGATFNTFLIGSNSPSGIRVEGQLVMGARRLSGDSEIEVGNFLMRFVKETPAPRVEFGF